VFVWVVAPQPGKIIKNGMVWCFWKRRNFSTRYIWNHVGKLEFTQAKNRLFWKGYDML